MKNITPLTQSQIEARHKNSILQTLCVSLCETTEGLPPEASEKLWKAFEDPAFRRGAFLCPLAGPGLVLA